MPHVGLNILGGTSTGARSSLTTRVIDVNLRNNGIFDAEVAFENGQVDVYLSNSEIGMQRTLVLEHTIPDFVPSSWYLAFAAATGGRNDRHVIHSIRLQAQAS